MRVKDISTTLGGLLNQANQQAAASTVCQPPSFGAGPVYGSPEDSIPDELQDEPIFQMNYKSEQDQCINKAKQSIMIIVKQIVPAMMQEMPLIKDKIKQDAEQLGNLYYQYKKKETYHQALMDIIARGDHSVKAFDVCEKISRSLEELGQNITTFQNQLRKFYIDAYLDLQHKMDEDEIIQAKLGYDNDDTLKITQVQQPIPLGKLENRVVGTEAVTRNLSEIKKAKLKSQFQDNQQ